MDITRFLTQLPHRRGPAARRPSRADRTASRLLPALVGAAVWALLATAQASAQEHEGHMDHAGMEPPADARGDLMRDLEATGDKFASLAEALRDHWDWRPAEDVRSVGEVVGHVADANFRLPTYFGHHVPEAYRGADDQETSRNLIALESGSDPDAAIAALRHSFMHAAHGIGMTPPERMVEPLTLFGSMETTVGGAMLLTVTHAHEHLGQLIAYARTIGVAPPWSGGE